MGNDAIQFVTTAKLIYHVKDCYGLRRAIHGASAAADLLVNEGLLGPMATREQVYQELKKEGFVQTHDLKGEFLGQIEAVPITKRVLKRTRKPPSKKGAKDNG